MDNYPEITFAIENKFKKLRKDKLTLWEFFNSGKMMAIVDFYGRTIQYSGVRFEGSPREVFWGGFIEPFLEDIFGWAFELALSHAEKRNLDRKELVLYTRECLLNGLHLTYSKMQKIDRVLRGKGYPDRIPLRDISREINKMQTKLDEYRDSAIRAIKSEGAMKIEGYFKKEIVGFFQNPNWQELSDYFRSFYDPLSLREFRGYVESIVIDDYTFRHWLSSNEKKGFGELMVYNAGKEWKSFKIRFYDSSDDEKRFLKLELNCDDNKIILIGSLDNKDKLNNVFSTIVSILGVKIIKSKDKNGDSRFKFYNKWWFKLLLAPIIVSLVLLYFQNKSASRQNNNFQNSSANAIKNANIAGDVVGRDKIIYQPVVPISSDQKNIDRQGQIKISKVKINRIIGDLSLQIGEIKTEYFKGSERIANDFNSRNVLSGGMHIKAQMDFAISTKEKVEKLLIKTHRDIEDVLLENFSITNLTEIDEFSEENSKLSELEKNTIPVLYKQLENAVRNQEVRSLGTVHITENFKL